MKKIIYFLLFFLSCLACVPKDDGVRIYSNKINALRNSTVALVREPERLESSEENTRRVILKPYCTAFFVSDTRLLTAAHCVDVQIPRVIREFLLNHPEMNEMIPSPIGKEVKFSTYQMFTGESIVDFRTATVIKFDRNNDLAMLEVSPGQNLFFREVVNLPRNISITEGQYVATLGHPGHSLWTVVVGRVSAYPSRDLLISQNQNYIEADINIFMGNSGGALIDRNGNVIGVASMTRLDIRQGYFVRHSIIFDFVNR